MKHVNHRSVFLSTMFIVSPLLPSSSDAKCPPKMTLDAKICLDRPKDINGCCHINTPNARTPELRMIKFKAGQFQQGSNDGDPDEKPVHTVHITHDYYMMRTEVTQEMYRSVMKHNPSWFKTCGSDCPVEEVNWYDAVTFANKYSKLNGLEECYEINHNKVTWPKGLDCKGYRLPTEAEWEAAARGGTSSQGRTYPWGNQTASCQWAIMFEGGGRNQDGCNKKSTWPVCSKPRGNTRQGLCDMGGNIFEWVWDGYAPYTNETQTDPTGDKTSTHRVFRGGSWKVFGHYLRTSGRSSELPGIRNYLIGFRLARTAD